MADSDSTLKYNKNMLEIINKRDDLIRQQIKILNAEHNAVVEKYFSELEVIEKKRAMYESLLKRGSCIG